MFVPLSKSDVYACISNNEIFDFLIDTIPNEELKALKKYPAEGCFRSSHRRTISDRLCRLVMSFWGVDEVGNVRKGISRI